jgi:hypothetical protein
MDFTSEQNVRAADWYIVNSIVFTFVFTFDFTFGKSSAKDLPPIGIKRNAETSSDCTDGLHISDFVLYTSLLWHFSCSLVLIRLRESCQVEGRALQSRSQVIWILMVKHNLSGECMEGVQGVVR